MSMHSGSPSNWARTAREEVEGERLLHAVNRRDDGVPRVVPACAASADIGLCSQDVHKLALALVAPLRAEDYGHCFRFVSDTMKPDQIQYSPPMLGN